MKKISELISALRAVMEKEGDIEILCDTQDGGVYSPSSVATETWTRPDGSKVRKATIG